MDPFIGEIKMIGFGWPPKDWALCAGAVLPIAQNQALFSLLGCQFGGDCRTSFALPDLRGRAPMHPNQSYSQGTFGGYEFVTLTEANMPSHNHSFSASSATGNKAHVGDNSNRTLATAPTFPLYGTSGGLSTLNSATVADAVGGGQSHYNVQPSTAVSFCIALDGTYPSRN